jgi:hypothetical protein
LHECFEAHMNQSAKTPWRLEAPIGETVSA